MFLGAAWPYLSTPFNVDGHCYVVSLGSKVEFSSEKIVTVHSSGIESPRTMVTEARDVRYKLSKEKVVFLSKKLFLFKLPRFENGGCVLEE